jgi:predicted nuclease of restriction endonuclease-like RecB superfamily
MLTKDLLRVSRAGGGYRPRFSDSEAETLAARVLGIYQGHVGKRKRTLDAALADLERDADDFKLVGGFAKLLEREATFERRSPIEPRRARTAAFEAAETIGVTTDAERAEALAMAAERLGSTADDIEASLFADRDTETVLRAIETDYDPESLRKQYDLSLAQTALFDAVSVRIRTSEPKALVSAVKRLRLMYEIRRADTGRVVIVTGPDALFRRSRRYGTRFARLLRTIAKAAEWELEATIDDRGTERSLRLDDGDLSVPGTEPVAEPTFDSGVESDFYARFDALDLDWELLREPEPLESGEHVAIPDFAFEWRYGGFRVFFEIMGFWTPEYVEKKLRQFENLEDVDFLVAYEESLGVGEAIEERGHRAIPYSGTVRLADVRDALRSYESTLRAESADSLPETLTPDDRVTTISALAEGYSVPERAIEDQKFPEHELVGRTLLRPTVLEELGSEIEAGMELSDIETVLDRYGIEETSAVVARLGYRVEWDGLCGGTIETRD